MKSKPRLLSVGRSAKTQKLRHSQTVPGMLQMQNDAKNKRMQRMINCKNWKNCPKMQRT